MALTQLVRLKQEAATAKEAAFKVKAEANQLWKEAIFACIEVEAELQKLKD